MKKITKYIADDGTIFEDESECLNYEHYKCLEPYLKSMDLRLYHVDPNGNAEIIPMQKICENLSNVMDLLDVIAAETSDALSAFLDIRTDYCYYDDDAFDAPGSYFYDPTSEAWTNVEEKLKYWQNVFRGTTLPKFKNNIAKEVYQKINGEESA